MSNLFFKKYILTKNTFICTTIILLSALVALYPFITQYIFGFDQARDGYEAYAIWQNYDFKIQGPSSDIPGIAHGVLWYYILALVYGIFQFSIFPVISTFFILSFLSIPLVGVLAYILFKNNYIAYVSMLLYAFSPMFQAFSRWLSNPVLAIYIAPLVLIGIYYCIKKPRFITFLLTGIGYGLLIQADFAYVAFLLTIPFYFYLIKNKRDKNKVGFVIGIIGALSSFILVELKFHGKTTLSLINFIFSPHTAGSFIQKITLTVDKLDNLLYHSILPLPFAVIICTLVIILIVLNKQKIERKHFLPLGILLIWLINLLVFFFFDIGITKTLFAYAPTFTVLLILMSYFLVSFIRHPLVLTGVLLLLCILQLKTNFEWIERRYNPYTAQQEIFYSDAKNVVDYSYTRSNREPFSLSTITNPLGINTTWSFMYSFHGKKEYGYVPAWLGSNQDGYLGELTDANNSEKHTILVIEPKDVIPEIYITNEIDKLNKSFNFVESKTIGSYTVQYYQKALAQN